MNFVKTTALLTLLTLTVMFAAAALGFDLVTSIFFVFLLTLPDLGTFDLIISLENVILGVTISSVIGILAGLLPALFASNLDPVEAIRSN